MAGRGKSKPLADQLDDQLSNVASAELTIKRAEKQIDRLQKLKKLNKDDKAKLKSAEERKSNAEKRVKDAEARVQTIRKEIREEEENLKKNIAGLKPAAEPAAKSTIKAKKRTRSPGEEADDVNDDDVDLRQEVRELKLRVSGLEKREREREKGCAKRSTREKKHEQVAVADEPEPARPAKDEGDEVDDLSALFGPVAAEEDTSALAVDEDINTMFSQVSDLPTARAQSVAKPAEVIARSISQLYEVPKHSYVQLISWLVFATYEVKENLIEVWISHPVNPETRKLPENPRKLKARATLWDWQFKEGNPSQGKKDGNTGRWIERPRLYRLTCESGKVGQFGDVRQVTPYKPTITGPFAPS